MESVQNGDMKIVNGEGVVVNSDNSKKMWLGLGGVFLLLLGVLVGVVFSQYVLKDEVKVADIVYETPTPRVENTVASPTVVNPTEKVVSDGWVKYSSEEARLSLSLAPTWKVTECKSAGKLYPDGVLNIDLTGQSVICGSSGGTGFAISFVEKQTFESMQKEAKEAYTTPGVSSVFVGKNAKFSAVRIAPVGCIQPTPTANGFVLNRCGGPGSGGGQVSLLVGNLPIDKTGSKYLMISYQSQFATDVEKALATLELW